MIEETLSSESEAKPNREFIGALAAATRRHTERLELDSMSVGPVGSPKSADRHPIVRVVIEETLPNSDRPVRLGSVEALPVYEDIEADPTTEADLNAALRGYTVRLTLVEYEFKQAPPYSLDYDTLDLEEIEPNGNYIDTKAITDTLEFESALQRLRTIVETLRDSREA